MTEISFRWSGLLLVIGAALLGISIVAVSLKPVIGSSLSTGVSSMLLLSSILLLLSLPAMYARQANEAGWLGLAGHGLLLTGVLLLAFAASPVLLYPSQNPVLGESLVMFLLGIALTVGLLLTGIATTRAGIFPRWASLLLLAATAGFFFVFFVAEFLPPVTGQVGSAVFGILLALALVGIGVSLLTGSVSTAS